MASYYTVVQYLPDPVTDERINIGVIVFGDGSIRTQFLGDWSRVQQFGARDITFLRDFVGEIEDATKAQPRLFQSHTHTLDEQTLRRMIGRWVHSIQFSQPKASLLSPSELLDDAAGRFLRERKRRGGGGFNPAQALERRLEPLLKQEMVTRNHSFESSRTGVPRTVDFYANSSTSLALDAVQLALKRTEHILERADAEAFKITDIQPANAVRFLVYCNMSPQPEMQQTNENALRIIASVGATVQTDLDSAADEVESAVQAVRETTAGSRR